MEKRFQFNISDKGILRWILYSLALAPIFILNNAMYPYAFSKIFYIRAVVAVFLGLFAFFAYKNRNQENFLPNLSKLNNPIYIALLVFTGFTFLSTLFGYNAYRSFFGDIQRSMGVLTAVYALIAATGIILFFRKTDWINFFKINILIGFIVFYDVIKVSITVIGRPDGHFINNPAFVAVYCLYIIFAASFLLTTERKAWKYLSILSLATAIITIFVTETRGVFVGIAVAVLAMSVWMILKGKEEYIGFSKMRFTYRKLGLFVLVALVLFGVVFMSTLSNPVWQSVPGLDRLSQISDTDPTTQTRILNTFVSLDAINPLNVGITKTLFGWGAENFNVAYDRFYDPSIQKYELSWFDRAHNQLLDILVMHGLFGLIAYLYLWFLIFRAVFSRMRKYSASSGVILASIFFAISYFVQNLFLFDQISALFPLYTFYAFVVFSTPNKNMKNRISGEKTKTSLYRSILYILTPVLVFSFIWLSYIPYNQMSIVTEGLRRGNFNSIIQQIDDITTPYNYGQEEIRFSVLKISSGFNDQADARDFVDEAVALQEEAIDLAPLRSRSLQGIGFMYLTLGKLYDDDELLILAQDRLESAVSDSPGRQELYRMLSNAYVSRGMFEKAKETVEFARNLEPEGLNIDFHYIEILLPYDWHNQLGIFDYMTEVYVDNERPLTLREIIFFRDSYTNHLSYFFRVKDVESFVRTMQNAVLIEQAIGQINSYQVENDIYEEAIPSDEARILEGLSLFRASGWDAIEKQAL